MPFGNQFTLYSLYYSHKQDFWPGMPKCLHATVSLVGQIWPKCMFSPSLCLFVLLYVLSGDGGAGQESDWCRSRCTESRHGQRLHLHHSRRWVLSLILNCYQPIPALLPPSLCRLRQWGTFPLSESEWVTCVTMWAGLTTGLGKQSHLLFTPVGLSYAPLPLKQWKRYGSSLTVCVWVEVQINPDVKCIYVCLWLWRLVSHKCVIG